MKPQFDPKMQQRIADALSAFVTGENLDDMLGAKIKEEPFADLALPNLADEQPDCKISFSHDWKHGEIICQIGPRNWEWNIAYIMGLLGRGRVKLQDQPELKGATHIEQDFMGRFWEVVLRSCEEDGVPPSRQRITKKNAMRLVREGKRAYYEVWSKHICEILRHEAAQAQAKASSLRLEIRKRLDCCLTSDNAEDFEESFLEDVKAVLLPGEEILAISAGLVSVVKSAVRP